MLTHGEIRKINNVSLEEEEKVCVIGWASGGCGHRLMDKQPNMALIYR